MPNLRNPMFVAAALVAAAAVVPRSARAQTGYYARVGAQYTSTLLEDRIVEPIEVRAGLGPAVAAGVTHGVGAGATIGLEGTLALTPLEADEAGLTRDLGSVSTFSALANLAGPISTALEWRVGFGLISYLGGSDAGIFDDGYPTRLLAGVGLDYRLPAFTRWDLMISARYDQHRFMTDALERRGFAGGQGVHRLSLGAGLARGNR